MDPDDHDRNEFFTCIKQGESCNRISPLDPSSNSTVTNYSNIVCITENKKRLIQYIQSDFDVNLKNDNGLTALELAAKQGTYYLRCICT